MQHAMRSNLSTKGGILNDYKGLRAQGDECEYTNKYRNDVDRTIVVVKHVVLCD
jgi:hypothetical protein